MTEEQSGGPKRKSRWREAWPVIVLTTGYMIPLFWLWNKTGFPDSLGTHIAAHGEAGLLESWWYSYLLLRRHHPWDIVTFAYMWAAAAGIVAWIGWTIVKDRKAVPMPGINQDSNEKGGTA